MKIEEFKAGTWEKRYQYESFEPSLINTEWTWDSPKIHLALERATRALGELNAFSLIVPDVDLFVQMHIVKEAQTSSKIEGTQTQMDEALMSKDLIQPEKRDDWQEVQNYIQAMNSAIAGLSRLPLSNRLLRETHAVLVSGVRGREKQPGEFRTSQNWIGGSNLNDAAFVPPHHEGLPVLMRDLEEFWHNDMILVPHLIRIAISHYQFETIHPFLDGNGRIGRLMIPLYLMSHGVLEKPSLYISDFFERYRSSYYDALMAVRMRNDLTHWVLFFLQAVEETSKKGCMVFKGILRFREEAQSKIMKLGRRAELAVQLLNLLYRNPIQTAQNIETHLNISKSTVNLLIKDFLDAGLIKEVTGKKRGQVFAMNDYLTLF
ncbi:Fic family protein [Basilea psittacipulmonis]|uniref:Toxin Fic n=1 Tax=Basilea psittacipulmonis DSM 24701 TaxID=1072685 RepID=A0A077DCW2_9BURK|nr:Fic family protein [Basilea psittacipulmonis]AIL32011.1 toxin Fic [Basilea psittacipulmonis DSM 24701]